MFLTFYLVILILCWKVHAIISCDHIFKITSDTVNFSLVQIMIWLLSYILKFLLIQNWIAKKQTTETLYIKESHVLMICINIKNYGMTRDSTKVPKSPTESTKNINSRLQAFGMNAFSWFWWCFCMIYNTHVHNISASPKSIS